MSNSGDVGKIGWIRHCRSSCLFGAIRRRLLFRMAVPGPKSFRMYAAIEESRCRHALPLTKI